MSRWSTVALGTVFEVQLGKMLDAKGNTGTPYPYLANRNVQWGRCDLQDLPTMRFTEADRKRFDLRAGDLLVCEGGEVGRTAIWEGGIAECYFQKAIHRLRGRRPVDARFALHYMRWAADNGTFRSLTTATSIAHLTKEKLELAPFPDAPFHEQQRIATILDAADALRAKRRAALAQVDTVTQAIFFEMFDGPTLSDWEASTIAAIAAPTEGSIRTGPFGSQLLHSEFTNDGIAVLGIDNAVANEFRWGERRYISPEKYRELTRYTVRPGDVLITIMGTCGRCAVVPADIPVAINTKHLCCITLDKERCLPEFLHAYFLRHRIARQYLERVAKGAIMDGLNMGLIKAMPIPVPPLPLQQTFARRAAAVEKLKAAHRASLAEMDALFASLQHRAFRGEL